jgi:hypothetical protein
VTFILELMPGFVNVIAVGHLGEAELASVSLAAMVRLVSFFLFFLPFLFFTLSLLFTLSLSIAM